MDNLRHEILLLLLSWRLSTMIICMLLFLITNNQNHCYNVHIDQVKLGFYCQLMRDKSEVIKNGISIIFYTRGIN